MSDEFVLIGAGVNPGRAKVRTPEGQLETFSVSVEEFENVSARERLGFSWTIVPADFAANETILLVTNDSDSLTLHITVAEFQTDNATRARLHLTDRADITPAGGAAVVGVCWNQTAPKKAPAIAFSNETANTIGNVIWDFPIAADTLIPVDLHGAVILGKGQSFGLDFVTAVTSLASCRFEGFFAIPDEARV